MKYLLLSPIEMTKCAKIIAISLTDKHIVTFIHGLVISMWRGGSAFASNGSVLVLQFGRFILMSHGDASIADG
jgi:hypothetical protein